MTRQSPYIILAVMVCMLIVSSCSTGRALSTNYYLENETMINSIRDKFSTSYAKNPFSIEFKDKTFRYISYEILSDTLKHIYNFDLENTDFADTLDKYNYNSKEIIGLVADMRLIKCTWISKLSYFEDRTPKSLVFISVRHNKLQSFFNGEKYYALVFFNEKQTFDERGRLTDKFEKKRTREINGEVFRKITDKICFAITGNFR